jgi:hypothetical protein
MALILTLSDNTVIAWFSHLNHSGFEVEHPSSLFICHQHHGNPDCLGNEPIDVAAIQGFMPIHETLSQIQRFADVQNPLVPMAYGINSRPLRQCIQAFEQRKTGIKRSIYQLFKDLGGFGCECILRHRGGINGELQYPTAVGAIAAPIDNVAKYNAG